jgi:hypothetical protein
MLLNLVQLIVLLAQSRSIAIESMLITFTTLTLVLMLERVLTFLYSINLERLLQI